jgi:hypothetical protein
MPTLADILARLAAVPTTAALLGLAATAGFLIIAADWRGSVLALAAQYLLAGLLLTRVIRPEIALIKTLIGAMICVVLYITARRVGWVYSFLEVGERPSRFLLALTSGAPFRIMAALMALSLAYTAALRAPLSNVPTEVTFGVFTLGMMGVFNIALADEPLKGGMGLLTVITGFELYYSSIEQSLTVVGFLGVVNFMIALAMSYLTTAQATPLPDEESDAGPDTYLSMGADSSGQGML